MNVVKCFCQLDNKPLVKKKKQLNDFAVYRTFPKLEVLYYPIKTEKLNPFNTNFL